MDDSGAFRLDEDKVLLNTVDFFTPVVDDPYDFGYISAVNAMSDIYAMGGTPLTALNITGFPASGVDESVLVDILCGGLDAVKAGGAVPMGGHSLKSDEIFYGLSVTGIVKPSELLRNNSARAGDFLVLTKPVGVGALTTALKMNLIGESDIDKAVVVMKRLNNIAAGAAVRHNATAATDVTGFGLIGHLFEMICGTGLAVELDIDSIPVLEGSVDAIKAGAVPGGMRANMISSQKYLVSAISLSETDRLLLSDPQTSGGLLIAISDNKINDLVDSLSEEPASAVIGRFIEDRREKIIVKRGFIEDLING